MRRFPYITLGLILQELDQEGLYISRPTFYRLEKRLELPVAKKTTGQLKWRVYSRSEAEAVKNRIKEEYNFE
jgi:predicted DNA-binding transcriptional regulator AlpA